MNAECSSLRPLCLTFFRKSVTSFGPGLLHPAVYYISSPGIRDLTVSSQMQKEENEKHK